MRASFLSRSTTWAIVSISLQIFNVVKADSWSSIGCYSDSPTARALGAASLLGSPDFTLNQCVDFCESYLFTGIESGQDCYCDNVVNSPSVRISDSSCNVHCTGELDTFCGGLDAIQIFMKNIPPPIIWNSIGCYTDSTSSRTLRTASFTSVDSMTIEACQAYCVNYPYAGVEFARECYCDTVIHSPGTLAAFSDCNMPCTGNPSENCGAGDRIAIFQRA